MNGVEDSFTEEVDAILAIQDKSTLKSKLTTLLKENHELKERVKELEDTLDGGEIYMIDSVPEEESNDRNQSRHDQNGGLATCDGFLSIFDSPKDQKEEKSKGGGTCWNCGGSHGLRDCKEERNHARINANREEFMKSKKTNTSSRYFKNAEFDVDVQPGLPNVKLQRALGLGDDQLPSYIYRMRELGYPPGEVFKNFYVKLISNDFTKKR